MEIKLRTYIRQFKLLKLKEILDLIIFSLLMSFWFSVVGFGRALQESTMAYGNSKLLKWIINLLPFIIFIYFSSKVFNKYDIAIGEKRFKHTILVFLFIVIATSSLVKVRQGNGSLMYSHNYIVYSQALIPDTEPDEYFNGFNIINEGVVLASESNMIPVTDVGAHTYVRRDFCNHWETGVLLD